MVPGQVGRDAPPPQVQIPLKGLGRGCGGGWGDHRRDACGYQPPALPRNSWWSAFPFLILVGTVHGDPAGYGRAWRLLERLQPQLITVEISPFSLRYRSRHEWRWQRWLERALAELPPGARGHLAIRRLKAQVEMPFEVRAARDWGRAKGVQWRALDLGDLARRELPRYETELFSVDNLRGLLGTEDGFLEDWVAGEYHRARAAWRRAPWRLHHHEVEARPREVFQARRLRNLAARSVRIVHLGGWEHLAPWRDGSGLTAALADLRPLALLLEDAEGLPQAAARDLAGAGLDSEAVSC